MSFRSAVSDVFHDRADFDYTGRRRIWFAASAIALLVSFGALGIRGLNLGIEFEGGTAWQVEATGGVTARGVREILRPLGEGNARIAILGGDEMRVQSINTDPARVEAVQEALAEFAGVDESAVSVQTVGPTFGEEVTEKAIRALVIFLIAVLAYLALRFEFKMAVAAMVALAHDVALTVGVYALTGFEVTPATVVAILTILGYSLYDTVVVFDKVKDHVDALGTGGSQTYSATMNRSLNEVLMRSLNTSITTLIPVASLLVVGAYALGAVTIRDFSLALFIGLLMGTYSSIFVAAQVLAVWKEREPRYRAMRRRSEARQPVPAAANQQPAEGGAAEPRPSGLRRAEGEGASAGAGASSEGDEGETPRSRRPPATVDPDLVVQPRARRQRRRKRRR